MMATLPVLASSIGNPLQRMTGIKIKRLHLADFTFPAGSPRAGQTGVVFAFLVLHPQGPVLFDTGMVEGSDLVDRLFKPARHSLALQVQAVDVRLSDIQVVINCHLHFDHCGNNRLFLDARFLVQTAEWDAAQAPNYTIREAFDFPGARIELVQGEAQVLPGLSVIPTPGHTPGHQSVVVETPEGRVVLAGQAAYSPSEFSEPLTGQPSGLDSAWDKDHYLKSIQRIHDLRPLEVHFSHDRGSWRRLSLT